MRGVRVRNRPYMLISIIPKKIIMNPRSLCCGSQSRACVLLSKGLGMVEVPYDKYRQINSCYITCIEVFFVVRNIVLPQTQKANTIHSSTNMILPHKNSSINSLNYDECLIEEVSCT